MFKIEEDIRSAQTLSTDFYTDEKYFSESKEKIFARSWQFITDTHGVKLPGQLYPWLMLEGFMDEPLLIVRDKEDSLRCLSNVCTHRGNLLVSHPCQDKEIKCHYHGRRFSLSGEMIHMPEFEGVCNFPSEKDNLVKVPFGTAEQFLFASLDPSFKFEEAVGEMMKRIGWLPLNEFRFDPTRSRDYLVKCHWALYCENYLEGFHIPFVHQSLNTIIDFGSYKTELYKYANLQIGYSKGGYDVFDLPPTSSDYGKNVSAYYFWIFPNMMFNFYPWGLSVNIIKPLNPNLTRISFLTYVYDEKKLNKGAGADLDKVEREDESIVETVNKGIHSRFYKSGRYSPTREQGVHQFHRLIAEFMSKS